MCSKDARESSRSRQRRLQKLAMVLAEVGESPEELARAAEVFAGSLRLMAAAWRLDAAAMGDQSLAERQMAAARDLEAAAEAGEQGDVEAMHAILTDIRDRSPR